MSLAHFLQYFVASNHKEESISIQKIICYIFRFLFSIAKWHEICINAPYAIQEVLFAWEHGALSGDSIKVFINKYFTLGILVNFSFFVCFIDFLFTS